MERNELLKSKGYWLAKIQIELFQQLEKYMRENNLNRTELATRLGVTKGYISQVLNGNFNHHISKLVELAIAMERAPIVKFEELAEYIKLDELNIQKEFKYAPKTTVSIGYYSSKRSEFLITPGVTTTVKKVSKKQGFHGFYEYEY